MTRVPDVACSQSSRYFLVEEACSEGVLALFVDMLLPLEDSKLALELGLLQLILAQSQVAFDVCNAATPLLGLKRFEAGRRTGVARS